MNTKQAQLLTRTQVLQEFKEFSEKLDKLYKDCIREWTKQSKSKDVINKDFWKAQINGLKSFYEDMSGAQQKLAEINKELKNGTA